MSIEGMLCAAGLALLAAGVLARTRTASISRPAPIATETSPPQGQASGTLGERSRGWWAGTAALWLGGALLLAAGGVVILRLVLFSIVS
ncbi:MAG: hypothetical protein ACK4V6_01780 [Microthrixaceae bacterium]